MSGSLARAERDIYSVSRLNREVRVLLERGFGTLVARGGDLQFLAGRVRDIGIFP